MRHFMRHFVAGLLLTVFNALGVNVFAVDLPTYIAKYETKIGTPPACNITISSATDPNWAKLNDSNYRVICLRPGDYTSKGTITLTASGAAGAERWLRYDAPNDTGLHPARQQQADQAVIAQLQFNGAHYWIVDRITLRGSGLLIEFPNLSGSSHNILNRVLAEKSYTNPMIVFHGTNDNNTLQNSVVRFPQKTPGRDMVCIALAENVKGTRIVNNEIYDCASHTIQIQPGDSYDGTIIENNDLYVTPSMYTDGLGTYTTNGLYAASESPLSFKGGASSANPVRVIHNRITGSRFTDLNVCCAGGEEGQAIQIGYDKSPNVFGYILIMNNIIWNDAHGIVFTWAGSHNISVIQNIFFDFNHARTAGSGAAVKSGVAGDTVELYLNTVINAPHFAKAVYSGANDWRCNVFINAGTLDGSLGTGQQFGSNSFYNTTPVTTGDPSKDNVYTSASDSMNLGLCFTRNPWTSPERICIPYAWSTTSSPHSPSKGRGCPSDVGSRLGIGIDDNLLVH